MQLENLSNTDDLNSFRDKITTTKMINNKIVIDKQFAKDCPDIFNILRGYEISILNEKKPIHEIADEVHSAHYYVCSHLTTAIYGIFLSEEATLIERRILDAGCIDISQKLAMIAGCSYKEVGHEDIFNIGEFHEYFDMPLMYPVNVDCVNEVIQYIESRKKAK